MRINVYKSYTGKEFDSYEFDAQDGKTVGEIFPKIDYENSLVFCNGNKINKNYAPKGGDTVTIRTMPSSMASLIVAGVVLAAFGIAEGISYGVTGKGLFKNLAEYLMPDVPTPKNNEQSQTETLPSLKGAKNQRAFGKPVPLVIGQSRLTPYLVGSYHTITGNDGENQRFHALYVLGYNDISAGVFKIGEQDLASNGMTEKYSSGNYSLEIGESNKKKGSITDFNELTPFSSANPLLEISNSGELDAYRQKVTEEAIGRQIINADGTPLVFERASDQHPRTIQVEISFNSLFAYNDKGSMVDAEAKIGIAISYNGGNTYEPFNPIQGNNGYENVEFDRGTICVSTIRRSKNKTLRFIAQLVIAPDRAWEIERANGYAWVIVQRMDKDSTDSKTSNKAYLSYIRTYVYDKTASFDELGNLRHPDYLVPQAPIIPKLRDKTTRVAFEIDATDNVSGTLDELNCMVVANCRTFSGGKWSDGKSPTSNPAANALNLMQGACLGSNAYGDEKIDLYAFGEMYEFCESNGFSVGGVLTSQKKLSDVIDLILRNARSYRTVSGRKYSVFVDKPASVPVCVLNNSNLLAGEISNAKNFDTLPDGFKISFVNKNLGYDEDEAYVMFDEGKSPDDPNTVIESVDMPFVTDPRQIAKNAWFEYAKRKLRPETWTRTVSTEANLIEIGSLVELQDDTIQVGIGNGGYIRSLIVENGLIKGFVSTDRINVYDVAKEYGVKITHSSETDNVSISVRKLAVSEPFYSDTFYFYTPIAENAPNAPDIGDLVSFGEYGKETISCLCINKKDKGDGKFSLELLPYDRRVYDADKNANLEFDSKVSTVQKNVVQSTNDYVTQEQLMERENAIINGIDKNSEPPDTPIVESCKAYRDYVSVAFGELPAGIKNELKAAEWQVNKGAAWEDFPAGLSFGARYEFAREVDGYPEAENLNWRFRCRVTNVAGKKSEWSDPRAVDTSGYGTWRVSSARDGRARTYNEQGLYLAFDSQRPNTRVYYGNTLFRVTVKYGGNALEIVNNVPLNFYHYFDRETDGYPERHENAADGVRDLSLYSFEIRPVESFTGEQGEILEVAHIDVSGYGTWLIPEIAASAAAGEHSVSLAWTLDGETPYGAVKYDVLLDGSPIAENIARAHHAYRFAENLTKEEVAALKFSVRARNEAHGRTAEFAVDVSGYLGYKIERPEIAAKAGKDGIEVSWRRTNDFYGRREYVLLKDGGEIFRSERDTSFFLKFGEGEYPEKADIGKISLCVRIDGDEDSATSDAAEIDTEGYLTYVPSTPTVYPSASGRNASLSWNAQDGVYGFLGCEIQIAKAYKTAGVKCEPITDEAELEWFAPALGLNPYESLENYKKGEAGGRLEVRGTAVSFSLPLFGQDADGAEDTPYAFRLRGKSGAGKVSEWTSPLFVLCRAVSAHDVVKAWDLDDNGEKVRLDGALGARQIFAEELAAISANLGYITDGALRGNAYNYWAVSDTPMDDGSLLRRGSFRVGGRDQYILVEPRLDASGEPTGEYDITFVVGNYSVSASGTQIRGGAFEVYDSDGNLMFRTGADGNLAAVEVGKYYSTYPVRYNVNGYFSDIDTVFLALPFGKELYVFGLGSDGSDSTKVVAKKVGFSEKGTDVSPLGAWGFKLLALPIVRADRSGKAVLVYSRNGGMFFGVYDAATNSWSESPFDEAAASEAYNAYATDYGVVYWTKVGDSDYIIKYCGIDGRSAVLEEYSQYGIDNYYSPMYRDDADALYLILPYPIGTMIYRLDKSTYEIKQTAVFLVGQTAESAQQTVEAPVDTGCAEYFTHPRIAGNRLCWLANGNAVLDDDPRTGGVIVSGYSTFMVSVDISESVWRPKGDETAGFNRATVYSLKPSLRSGEKHVVPAGFSGSGSVLPVIFGDSSSSFEEHIFEIDDLIPDAGYKYLDFREGALVNRKVCDVQSASVDLTYCRNHCLLEGEGGMRICFVSNYRSEEVSNKDITTFYAEETAGAVAKRPMMSGVGFYRVLYDELSGRYRYCLDPATGIPAVLEFDRDGRLAAAKGDKGDPGDKGEKGDKGEPATTGNVWPVGSVWVTDNSSLDANSFFDGSWSKTNVLIGFKTWYYWKRNS